MGLPGEHLFASDEEAMALVSADGDPQAFALLVGRWRRRLLGVCVRLMGESQLAEDMVQETFLRLFAARERYQSRGSFGTYLRRIAINVCRDDLRRRKRRVRTQGGDDLAAAADAAPTGAGASPVAAAVGRETAEIVRRALLGLPAIYREVVVFRHYDRLPFAEIAEVLGIPVGTVKSRMAKALDLLAGELGPPGKRKTKTARAAGSPDAKGAWDGSSK